MVAYMSVLGWATASDSELRVKFLETESWQQVQV